MILESRLREILEYQTKYYKTVPLGVPRELNKKIDLKIPHVIIISGIRRCGKSTVLRQLIESTDPNLLINFEDPRLLDFEVEDFFRLEKLTPTNDGTVYYYFDEIQHISNWERYVRVLHDRKQKVIVSGSNASLLSKELGTSLTGRQITYELFPFSYSEFLSFTGSTASSASFQTYLDHGGFPEYLATLKVEVLHNLFNDIIYRDILVRHGLKNDRILKDLSIYLLTNIGKEFSYNKLSKNFSLGSSNTVHSYISYLEDAYLVFQVPRFSYSFRQQVINQKKVYAIDSGLSGSLSVSFSKDYGRKLENIIYLHLRKSGFEVYYYKKNKECDFVVCLNTKIHYVIQACLELNDMNKQREIDGLIEAMTELKQTKGFIITMDQEDLLNVDEKTIHVIPAWKWTLKTSLQTYV